MHPLTRPALLLAGEREAAAARRACLPCNRPSLGLGPLGSPPLHPPRTFDIRKSEAARAACRKCGCMAGPTSSTRAAKSCCRCQGWTRRDGEAARRAGGRRRWAAGGGRGLSSGGISARSADVYQRVDNAVAYARAAQAHRNRPAALSTSTRLSARHSAGLCRAALCVCRWWRELRSEAARGVAIACLLFWAEGLSSPGARLGYRCTYRRSPRSTLRESTKCSRPDARCTVDVGPTPLATYAFL